MPPGPPSSPSLPPGPPSSPSLPPSSPGSPSLTNVTPPSSPGSSSLTNVIPLFAPGPSKKTRTVRSRTKLLQSDSQKFLDQLKLEASQRPRPKSPPVIPIMPTHIINKIYKNKINKLSKKQDELSKLLKKKQDDLNKKDIDLDDFIKKLVEEKKLIEQQNEQNQLLE